jgi:hypothetical protein
MEHPRPEMDVKWDSKTIYLKSKKCKNAKMQKILPKECKGQKFLHTL